MSYSVHVICRPEVEPGFILAGVDTIAANGTTEAIRRIRELSALPETGVLLVQEDLLAQSAARQQSRNLRPLVIPFPAPAGATVQDAAGYIAAILRRAVGYRVRLE
jgi:V/A-type H+/Na+-transporting ATPase subunit F